MNPTTAHGNSFSHPVNNLRFCASSPNQTYVRLSLIIQLHTQGSRLVPLEIPLIPANTKLESNGDGASFDISPSESRTFLCELLISDNIEQESLDISIWGSADGSDFGKKPLLKIPQQFYPGLCKMVLDVSLRPEVRLIRARWELNRWGRVAPTPMFVVALLLLEIPPMSRETPTHRPLLAGSPES
jgi:hypothetical protein